MAYLVRADETDEDTSRSEEEPRVDTTRQCLTLGISGYSRNSHDHADSETPLHRDILWGQSRDIVARSVDVLEDGRKDCRIGESESDKETPCSGLGVVVLGEDDVHVR